MLGCSRSRVRARPPCLSRDSSSRTISPSRERDDRPRPSPAAGRRSDPAAARRARDRDPLRESIGSPGDPAPHHLAARPRVELGSGRAPGVELLSSGEDRSAGSLGRDPRPAGRLDLPGCAARTKRARIRRNHRYAVVREHRRGGGSLSTVGVTPSATSPVAPHRPSAERVLDFCGVRGFRRLRDGHSDRPVLRRRVANARTRGRSMASTVERTARRATRSTGGREA